MSSSDVDLVKSWLNTLPSSTLTFDPSDDDDATRTLAELARRFEERKADVEAENANKARQCGQLEVETRRCKAVFRSLIEVDGVLKSLIRVLASCASTLGLSEAGEARIAVAVSQVQLLGRSRRETSQCGDNVDLLRRLNRLKAANQRALASLSMKAAEKSKKAEETEFLKKKQAQYAKNADKLEVKIPADGKLRHEALVRLHGQVVALQTELKPIKAKLDGFRDLPPDMELAQLKLAEAEAELSQLSDRLVGDIESLKL